MPATIKVAVRVALFRGILETRNDDVDEAVDRIDHFRENDLFAGL